MTKRSKNNIALVTGAARGIGRATALMLRDRGARVVATDISETVHELSGDGIVTLTGSVAEEETARRSVALASDTFGGARHPCQQCRPDDEPPADRYDG